MTGKKTRHTRFITAINGSDPEELVLSFYHFLENEFPELEMALYNYHPVAESPQHRLGSRKIDPQKISGQEVRRFDFPVAGSDGGYTLFVVQMDSDFSEMLKELCDDFGRIFNIVNTQRTSALDSRTGFCANLISQLSHDLTTLLHQPGDSAEDLRKVDLKKRILSRSLPRLLTYLRPLQISRTRIACRPLLEAVLDKYEQKSAIRIKLSDNVGDLSITCDLELIDTAVTELLDNAVFAGQIQGGEIILTARHIQRTFSDKHTQWLEIAVQNPEGSIPSDFLPMVKTALFSTWNNQGKGGMGLALADHIARAHGGICRISSDPKIGVKQSIYLPIITIDEKT